MDEKIFLYLVISFSVIGILLIYILSSSAQPDQINISDVSLGKMVKILGTVSNIEESKYERADYDNKFCLCLDPDKKSASFYLTDSTGKIKIWVPDKTQVPLPEKNKKVVVTGNVQEYLGELEVVAEKISSIN